MSDNVVNLDAVRPTAGAVLPAVITEAPLATPETVVPLEPILVPLDKLRAVLLCAAKEETRYYLNGVFVHRTETGHVRAVATDGHRLMVANLYREFADQPGPAWLDAGVIIPADGLAARLALIAKTHGKLDLPLTIAYATDSAKIEISDDKGESVFRLARIDGTFPDYAEITGKWTGEGGMTGDWQPTGFDPKYLKSIADIANRLGAKGVECFAPTPQGKDRQGPALFTFSGVGGVAMYLMPRRCDESVSDETRELLAPSVKLTLAALRAHETRNRKAAKKLSGPAKDDAIAKADDFKARIEALMQRMGSGEITAALPAPTAPAETEHDDEQLAADGDDEVVNEDTAQEEAAPVEAPAAEEQPVVEEPVKAPTRGGRKGAKAKSRKARKNLH